MNLEIKGRIAKAFSRSTFTSSTRQTKHYWSQRCQAIRVIDLHYAVVRDFLNVCSVQTFFFIVVSGNYLPPQRFGFWDRKRNWPGSLPQTLVVSHRLSESHAAASKNEFPAHLPYASDYKLSYNFSSTVAAAPQKRRPKTPLCRTQYHADQCPPGVLSVSKK